VDISSLTLTGEEKGMMTAICPVVYRSGQGVSGSKLRRIVITTSRIRVFMAKLRLPLWFEGAAFEPLRKTSTMT